MQLKFTTSLDIIASLKLIFSRHGIPDLVRSDNELQYSSLDISKFASFFGFTHITSSPLYPQGNYLAERMVQTVERLLKQSQDPYLAWMSYHSTSLSWCSFSSAELLIWRRILTTVPQPNQQLIPKWPYMSEFRKLMRHTK